MAEKKELRYFNIGNSYGGNQRWMIDPWMHIGGCGALTACDIFIYMMLYKEVGELCPYDVSAMMKKQYRKFAMSVRPYLRPRESGIKDLETFMEGVRIYLEDVGETGVTLTGFDGSEPYEKAAAAIVESIDRDIPLAYLMLKHSDRKFDFFEWHWFPVIGYEKTKDGLMIKVATYGKAHWLPLRELWDTGYDEKGGMVLFDIKKSESSQTV